MKKYDLVVIGTGAAGATAAYEVKAAGWKVAVIDNRPFGGTCALRGCDPKKILVGAAEIIDRSSSMNGKGILHKDKINWSQLMKVKNTFTGPIPKNREKDYVKAGINTFHGTASFINKNTLKIGNKNLEAKYVVIATGAKPLKLNIPGEKHIITSDDFLEMKKLPKNITLIGGGFISFEFAHIAARAGSKVRIFHRSERPLKNFDQDLVKMLIKASEELGIKIYTNTPVNSIEKKGNKFIISSGKKKFKSDLVVHGAGRAPYLEDLDLGKAGVKAERKGVTVNSYMQSVSNPKVYAAGDASASGLPLTPVAGMEGDVAAQNMLKGNKVKADYISVPSVVFTTPPLASVGINEDAAKKLGLNYKTNYQDTSKWYTSKRIGLKYSGSKVLIDKKTDRILGDHLLGHGAEEVINLFAMAIKLKLKSKDMKNMIWAYPTTSSDIGYMV